METYGHSGAFRVLITRRSGDLNGGGFRSAWCASDSPGSPLRAAMTTLDAVPAQGLKKVPRAGRRVPGFERLSGPPGAWGGPGSAVAGADSTRVPGRIRNSPPVLP
jgi:hypothetical protein